MNHGLSEIRRERKFSQLDAQMLANRIKYLELEDQKTWKKIQDTKRRAEKLAYIKKENEERLYMLYESRVEKERALSEKRSHFKKNRENSKSKKSELMSALINCNQAKAKTLKKERKNDLRRLEWEIEDLHEDKIKKKEAVFQGKVLGKAKILDFHYKKGLDGRSAYWKEIEENEKLRKSTEKEVAFMEKLEIELINKLKNTQTIQKQAVEDLNRIMNSPGIVSIYNSMIKKRKYSNLF